MSVTYPSVVTSSEVAAALGAHLATVREWARDGLRPARRLGRYWRFSAAAVIPTAAITPSHLPEVLSTRQAAEFLRVPVSTIYAAAKQERIPCEFRGHRGWRFERRELVAWLAHGEPTAASPLTYLPSPDEHLWPPVITTHEVAEIIGIHLDTARRRWAGGNEPPHGRRVSRFRRHAAHIFLPADRIAHSDLPILLTPHQASQFLRVPTTAIYSAGDSIPGRRTRDRYPTVEFNRDQLLAWLAHEDDHAGPGRLRRPPLTK